MIMPLLLSLTLAVSPSAISQAAPGQTSTAVTAPASAAPRATPAPARVPDPASPAPASPGPASPGPASPGPDTTRTARPSAAGGAPARTHLEPGAEEKPTITHHQVVVNGQAIHYTATVGKMPLQDPSGQTQAQIFYVAYTRTPEDHARPLLFAFNGGPGSASIWLQIGAIGPRRVQLTDDGKMPPPPFKMVDNESTWLDRADLVFIDPVGTGYSEATKQENSHNYWGVRSDIDSMADFVRIYLNRSDRWNSPLFLAGESYGTFRAAGLSGALMDDGIALNGVILISTVLDFRLIASGVDDDMVPYSYLPSYAATAWYHRKLAPDLQQRPLPDLLSEVERWDETSYLEALSSGSALSADQRSAIIRQLSRYTSLSPQYLDNSNLRVSPGRFRMELLRDRKLVIGRYDSRATEPDIDAAGENARVDPSFDAVDAPFTMAFNQYLRVELGYHSDLPYKVLVPVGPWDFGTRGMGFAETASDLQGAMTANPYLKLFVAMGYYDLATPYFSVEYTLRRLEAGTPSLKDRITTDHYESGHMIYTSTATRKQLTHDIDGFIQSALSGTAH